MPLPADSQHKLDGLKHHFRERRRRIREGLAVTTVHTNMSPQQAVEQVLEWHQDQVAKFGDLICEVAHPDNFVVRQCRIEWLLPSRSYLVLFKLTWEAGPTI